MEVIHSITEARSWIRKHQREGNRIGLVPTMGALHEGHLSLIDAANRQCELSACTIFVNPTQFGPQEDLARYPRTLENDLRLLRERGTGLVFVPSPADVYPDGYSTYVEPPEVAKPLEGTMRPGHFRGVATVVLKLFQMLPADLAFFGQKDFQQVLVVKRMVEDFNLPVEIHIGPTVREDDGLAMSSRNRYLTSEERNQALGLSRALRTAAAAFRDGERDVTTLESSMRQILSDHGIERIDYATVRDRERLHSLTEINTPAVALIAAWVGQTRLIDNWLLDF